MREAASELCLNGSTGAPRLERGGAKVTTAPGQEEQHARQEEDEEQCRCVHVSGRQVVHLKYIQLKIRHFSTVQKHT